MVLDRLISLLGLFVLMFLAWVASRDRKNINVRLILTGLLFQCVFAFIVFKLSAGVVIFSWLNDAALKVISFAKEGIYFVFGPLSVSPGETGPMGETSPGFILAFQVLPSIIFFSSLVSLLYYLNIIPAIIKVFARIFTYLMRISGAEALCASSNIFVGIESAVTIRPYIQEMTRSELCTVLTVGMGTIASTVLALYVGFLHREFPSIAGHLISASVISAPAAIIMSKLVVPEIERPKTLGISVHVEKDRRSSTWIESIIMGANDGVKLCVGIITLLLAFLGLLSMFNWLLGFVGTKVFGTGLSLQMILKYLYYPITLIMGVPFQDAEQIATLLGERTIVTEVVSYQHLHQLIKDGVITDTRSITIASYALCGFAHIASLAIFVGGFSALAPSRAKDLAQLGFRALYAATLACLMTGCVAGLFV
ncbi:MAG: nucleoside transporter [Deltaproteobacteria bacterium]|nr:nucleoside transporter [Deltaproteobacteria bacterium]MBW1792918.1 nucleoside transporter [Deltaproteobacteria bacterium]MBW2329443.1 nucleoside transporter [Deltaproteobacteria bacterium]